VPSLLLCALLNVSPPAEQADAGWVRLVGLLQYLEGDYARAVELKDAEELAEQRGLAAEALAAADALGDAAKPYRPRLEAIRQRIDQGLEASAVVSDCGQLAQAILDEQHLQRAPKRTPDLRRAAELWAANCAVCHGETGDAKTPVAATLTPRPFNFHDPERMAALTPYRAFNTTGFGVKGTAMPAFPSLSEDERWSLAFYAFTFRQPACDHEPPRTALQVLAQSTDAALSALHTPAELPCLRRRLPEETKAAGLFALARNGIVNAQALYASGKHDQARAAVVDAYLSGIEPVEPTLRARNPALVKKLEQGFTRTRVAADRAEHFEEESTALLELLARSEVGDGWPADFWSVFFAALLILLREGFEALVVVGALLAVLKKMNATHQANIIYAAVLAALAAGIVALLFAQSLLAGANREWMETIVAFFAVAMLLYAALWLNKRSTISGFMTELRGQMQTALGSGSNAGLFTVAFTAVARESFETALFIEGLAGDSARGALWGAAAGLLALAVMVGVIRKVGFVLPMKTLFSASTGLLLATAVMVLGKGLHGLQEVGVLGLRPVPFFQLDALGIFPDAVTLGPQLVLGCAALWWWRRTVAPAKPAAVA
jgi:high-affinity iron transporter